MAEPTEGGANGWGRTLETATEMTEDMRADGWDVVTIRAGHTAPVAPEEGEADRFGYVYLAQGEDADAFEAALAGGSFDTYTVFNRRVGDDLFVLTRLTDPDREVAVLLVGAVDLTAASAMAEAARDAGEMYSHVELLDGTHLGSFHHDDPDPFLPEDV